MSSIQVLVATGSPRAHPVTGLPHVEVPVLAVMLGVATVVTLTLLLTPGARSVRQPPPPADTFDGPDRLSVERWAATGPAVWAASWAGSLSLPQVAVRAVAVLLLGLAIVAGRFGSANELENLAPALVVGAGWPLLTVASLVLPVWRWVDPWDSLARIVARKDDSEPARHVWPAVVLAAAWFWFLAAYPRPLDPRAVGVALLGYTTLTLAGCLVVGRRRWLSGGEPVGILLGWVSAAGRSRLPAQGVSAQGSTQGLPHGAAPLIGVALGGLLFAVLRRSELWTEVSALPDALLYDTATFAVACIAGAALLTLAAALGARGGDGTGDRGAVLQAALPALVGVVAALALERNRLFNSVQLLPGLLGDPFGAGWDLLGPAASGLDPDPLGASGLVVAQVAVLSVGLVWGAVVAARGSARTQRLPAAVVLLALSTLSTFLVSQH